MKNNSKEQILPDSPQGPRAWTLACVAGVVVQVPEHCCLSLRVVLVWLVCETRASCHGIAITQLIIRCPAHTRRSPTRVM